MKPTVSLRRVVTLLCGLCFLSGVTPGSADTATNAKTLLQNLAFPQGKRVPYAETQMNPMLKEPVSQAGHVEITEDGAFIMQVATPRPELRRLENGKLSLKRPSRSALKRNPSQALTKARARTLTLNPEHGGHLVLLAITQVLSGDIDTLSQNFSLQSTPGEPWRVVLTPKNAKVKKRLQRLELLGSEDQLLSLYTQRTNDAWQKLTFNTSEL